MDLALKPKVHEIAIKKKKKVERFDGIVEMCTYDFLTVSDIMQSRKRSVNWYDGDDNDDRAFKLLSKYKESAGNQTTEIVLFLFFVFTAMKVAGALLIVAVGNPRPTALNDVGFQAS